MNVISISTDRKIFEDQSSVRSRTLEQAKYVDSLHIIVYSLKKNNFKPIQIGTNVWIHPTNSFFKFFYIRNAVRIAQQIIKENKLTAATTVVTSQDPFETGIAAVEIKEKNKFPLQIQIHTDFLSPYFGLSFLNRMRIGTAKKLLPHADEIRVVSEKIKKSLSSLHIVESKIDVLPVFVETHKFNQPINHDLKKMYPQFNFIILMASRLAPEKNIFSGLRIFKEIVKKNPKAGLVVVGEGSKLQDLQKYTEKLNLKNNVVFEPWQQDLSSYYQSANVFLVTSLYEGFGLTLVEAGLSGATIVTSDVGIAGSLFKDGQNSFVCHVNDEACFIDKVTILMNDNGIRERFKVRIKEDLSGFLISDSNVYFETYKKLLEKALLSFNSH